MHIIWFLVDGFRLCLHPGGKTMKGQRTITEVNPERKVPPVLQFDKDQFEYNHLTEPKCFTLEEPRWGPLMGGPQCRMSILRNGNVACLCRLFSPMSDVEFKKRLCLMSLHFYPSCRMSLSSMSHVELKKSMSPCQF